MCFRHFALVVTVVLAAVPARAALPVDGVYKGSAALGANRNGHCGPGITFNLVVTDGAFTWGGLNQEKIVVRVGPDGTFNAQNGRRFMQGRIANGTLTAHVSAEYCEYDWSLTR